MILKGFSNRDQILLMRQLASLLTAGLALLDALHLMMECCPKNWRSLLKEIILDLNQVKVFQLVCLSTEIDLIRFVLT